MNGKLILGCVADDFTGASDAASFLVKAGMKTMLFNGVPHDLENLNADAAVIALKTRTDETQRAVQDSLEAVEWFLKQDTEHIYSKYCSTFDCTPQGNIGPILDAILDRCQEKASILCPALPVNGRTVREGKLYVNGVPLDESPMKNHPLTPMWDSRIGKLMEGQSKYPCIELPKEILQKSEKEIQEYIEEKSRGYEKYYLVPDYEKDSDAEKLARLFGHMKVLSGGSGILTELGKKYLGGQGKRDIPPSFTKGRGIILAGSCSSATLEQIQVYRQSGKYTYKLDPLSLLDKKETTEEIWDRVLKESRGGDILIYSSDTPQKVKQMQSYGKEKVAKVIETVLSDLAWLAREAGFTRIIVAGGETSGAVTKRLGYEACLIGESIAPGVPVMVPQRNSHLRLVLKSGNFGQPDFFLRALAQTEEKNPELERKTEEALWAAHSLFGRGKTAGSTANISFRHGDFVYISASGTCFGTLKKEEFSVIDLEGNHVAGPKPSKEFPLHLKLYQEKNAGAVIHTHSFYCALWSCLEHENPQDVIPQYTPYLKMKVGTIGLIPYAPPGSRELFQAFGEKINDSDGYLLKNHGPVVAGKDMMTAFAALEELEESAKIAWYLRKEEGAQQIQAEKK